MKKLAILLMCTVLAGCGESEVDKVKSSSIKGFGNFTYGKVLDSRRVCETADWKEFVEDDVKKVSYVCHLKKGKVSYNFDENTAIKLRQNEKNRYIANQIKYLPEEIKTAEENLAITTDTVNKIKALAAVDDLIKTLSEAADDDGTQSSDIIDAMSESYYSIPEARKHIMTIAPYTMGRDAGFNIKTEYNKKKEVGFSDEEKTSFAALNELIKPYFTKRVNKSIKRAEEDLAVAQDRLNVLKERLENKDLLNKEGETAGENAVIDYSLTHILSGEEVIIWAWNPVEERYDVQRQYIKQNEYGDRYTTANLYIEHVIYSAINNISDVDVYMGMKRKAALTDLYNMIYK